jgi:hypothetical protein
MVKLPSIQTLENEALTKALLSLSDAKVNLPVAIAEAAKTIDLITGTASRVYSAYRNFRRGRFKGVAKDLGISPSVVHKTWLEYKYGWMPLLMDVKKTAEFVAQQSVGRPIYLTGVGRAEASASTHVSSINVNGWLSNGKASVSSTGTSKREVKVKIYTRVSNPRAAQLQQLGLTNPALVAWELVPFSFVFDWFISVGDYLQGISSLHGLTVDRAMTSSIETYDVAQVISEPSREDASTSYGGFHTHLRGESRDYRRGSISVSAAAISPVRNRDPLGFSKLVTAMALLRTRVR